MIQEHPTNWTILETQRQSNLVASAAHRAGTPWQFLATLRDTWKRVREIHATRKALKKLNDHQLRDIGVEPGTIDSIARASVLAHLTVAGLDHADNRPSRR